MADKQEAEEVRPIDVGGFFSQKSLSQPDEEVPEDQEAEDSSDEAGQEDEESTDEPDAEENLHW